MTLFPPQIGAVESSLCTVGTGSIFLATLTIPCGPSSFSWIVAASAVLVVSGALTYTFWHCFYLEVGPLLPCVTVTVTVRIRMRVRGIVNVVRVNSAALAS